MALAALNSGILVSQVEHPIAHQKSQLPAQLQAQVRPRVSQPQPQGLQIEHAAPMPIARASVVSGAETHSEVVLQTLNAKTTANVLADQTINPHVKLLLK